MANYQLEPGSEDDLTVFPLARPDGHPGVPWRVVTPICFEDIDADLCAQMCRPDAGDPRKRADVLVNVTNDGWFAANENAQHFQAAVFRSIENRVPTARAVNTGISGFIDPVGRTTGLLPARTDGTSVAVVQAGRPGDAVHPPRPAVRPDVRGRHGGRDRRRPGRVARPQARPAAGGGRNFGRRERLICGTIRPVPVR